MKRVVSIFGLVLLALAVSQVANASPIYLSVGAGGSAGDYIVGEVFTTNDIQGGLLVRDEVAIDYLVGMSLGQRSGTAPEYYRSTTDFGTLPGAVQTGAIGTNPEGFTIDGSWIVVTLSQPYAYLMGSYDGPNGGSELWYIGNIAAGTPIYIPLNAYPSGTPQNLATGDHYQATSWTAYNPTSVPDGGATVTLLGLAMVGLGFARRFKG